MIRFLLRFIGLICLAAGFILLIYDGTKSIAGNSFFSPACATLWELINAGSLAKLEPMIRTLCRRLPMGPADGRDLAAPSWACSASSASFYSCSAARKSR